MPKNPSYGLPFARLLMVLSSFTPLYILWIAKAVNTRFDSDYNLNLAIFEITVPFWVHFKVHNWHHNQIWFYICLALIILPTSVLLLREWACKKQNDVREIIVTNYSDRSEYLLAYLFATLLPLYDAEFDEKKGSLALAIAFLFIVFLFFHMRMHYMNLLYALRRYNVFTVEASIGSHDETETYVVLTRKHRLSLNKPFLGYRISDNVIMEK
jgi:hypothetical protein